MVYNCTRYIRSVKTIMLFSIIIPIIFSCKKDNSDTNKSTNTSAGPSTLSSKASGSATLSLDTANRKNLIFSNDFESSSPLSNFTDLEEAYTSSITVSDTVAEAGKYSMKVVVNKSDPIVNNGKRAEVTLYADSVVKVERWIGFSIFLPSSYIADPVPEAVQQYHDIPDLADGGVWRSPPFALETQNGHWLLVRRWSAATLTTNATSSGQTYDLGAYNTSTWTNWVFHIKFSWGSDGLIELWQNGKLILTVNGPNAYNDKLGNYFKLGIYKWGWLPEYDTGTSTTTRREVFYDNLRIGNASATYKDVAP
jgi:hypothetical protein